MPEKLPTPTKKEYQKPYLSVYGDIRKLTGTSSNMGGVVDAMFGSTKTS